MTAGQLQRGLSQAYHEGSLVWVPQIETINSLSADGTKKRITSWHRGVVHTIAQQDRRNVILKVKTETGSIIEAAVEDCCLQNERDDTVDDLVRSDFLHEPGILHTLQVRYCMDSIYTYSGQILIAANPHKRLKHLYGNRMMGQYRGVPLGELSPHVYAIAEAAYGAMLADEQRQAILISGESGAGKTESAKMVMQYLAHRAGPSSASTTSSAANGNGVAVSAPIEEQVLESNPLLEAFGNAKTARNDNSSRFGKFVEIDFDAAGRVTGASISTYLLERSRVVSIHSPERSFHIFYQLCAGSDEERRRLLHLEHGASSFRFLSQSNSFELDDVDDAEAFQNTIDAMKIVGLSNTSIDAILKCVAAVLHLGNIKFNASSRDEAIVSDSESKRALEISAELLEVTTDALLMSLTTRAIETRGERIEKNLDPEAAAESRDALAKSLYSRLFDWLVAAVNRKIGALGGGDRTARSIGILDIYGFECFDRNSFEQLCINLANEKLQQAFNAHVFKGEQAEYAEEGIAWSYVDFVDNQDVLDLLEGVSNTAAQGVFPLIDEACRLPRATHQDLAHALRTRLASHPRFGIPRRDQHAFAIDHYAGEVCYSTDALLDKNRDFVVAEHAALMAKSASTLLQTLFGPEKQLESSGGSGAHSVDGFDANSKRRSAFMLSTVGARFRKQLAGLMGTLGECQPHFIRCIKPNSESKPGAFASPYVLEQLRAGGVLEAVRISCAGFPTRKLFLPFAQRFAVLLGVNRLQEMGLSMTPTGFVDWYAAKEPQIAEVVKRVLKLYGSEGQWQMGRTRVFLRSGQLAELEGARGRLLSTAAVKVQAAWRSVLARRQLREARAAATLIARAWRNYVRVKEEARLRQEAAALYIQTSWRSYCNRKAYLLYKRTRRAIIIQKHWRRHMARTKFLKETEAGRRAALKAAEDARRMEAAIKIQAHWRRIMAQRYVSTLKQQAARVKALQQERDELANEKVVLTAALAALEARALNAESDATAKAARIASLESEIEEMRVQLQSTQAELAAAISAGVAGASAAQEAASHRAIELEEAHKRATAALKDEMEVAKQQKLEADERAALAEEKLCHVQADLDSTRAILNKRIADEEDHQAELQATKDMLAESNRENERIKVAAQASAVAAAAEAALALRKAEERAAAAEASVTSAVAAQSEALKRQVADAEAKAARNAAALRDAQEKSSQLAARVEALSSRAERLEQDAHAAADREATLLLELENTRRAAASRLRTPTTLASGLRSVDATPIRRTIAEELEAAANDLEAASPARGEGGGGLTSAHSAIVTALTEVAVFQRLPSIKAWSGSGGALVIPQAAWLVHKCLLQWAVEWQNPAEITAATQHVVSSIAAAAINDRGLSCSGYWLAASLAIGALLKMRVVGKPDLQQLFKLADTFIGLTDLHVALGGIIAEEIPINVTHLLSEDAKRSARRRSVNRPALAPVSTVNVDGTSAHTTPTASPRDTPATCAPAMPSSPADVELAHMGNAERHWRAILGSIANIVDVLKNQGVPAAAIRAVVWATLRYIDGELLNALLLRRDCCSVSAAKALLTGIAALCDISSFVGAPWGISPEEAGRAMVRSTQAAKYIIQGKDDCARKAQRGINVMPDLTRQCPSLTLQQVHRLTEHQHDDWLAGTGALMGSQTLILLDSLRRLMDENRIRLGGTPPRTVDIESGAAMAGGDNTTPGRWVAFGTEEESPSASSLQDIDDEDLLVDSSAPFAMFRMQFPVTRHLLTEAAKSFVVAPVSKSAASNGVLPQVSPSKDIGGSPQLPPSPAPAGLSLLYAIDESCGKAGLPEALVSNPNFAFLADN